MIFMLSLMAETHKVSFNFEAKGLHSKFICKRKAKKLEYDLQLITVDDQIFQEFGRLQLNNNRQELLESAEFKNLERKHLNTENIINTYNLITKTAKNKKILEINRSTAYAEFNDDGKINGNNATMIEGNTVRSVILDKGIFESTDSVNMIVSFNRKHSDADDKLDFGPLTLDNLTISRGFLTRAHIVSEKTGKPITITVLATPNIKKEDIIRKINEAAYTDVMNAQQIVNNTLPHERQTALMGGLSGFIGYHYFTQNFIFNLRAGIDYIWGSFLQTSKKNESTENMIRLGWGILLGTGIDYRFREDISVGLEGGIRLSELNMPLFVNPEQKTSNWFAAPYLQLVYTIYPKPDYSVSLFSGYTFGPEFSIKKNNARLAYGSRCAVSGLMTGIRFAHYFG